jgi:hypothetical protein
MPNPFSTRATEFVRNVEAFLSMVSGDPLVHFLHRHAKDEGLFRRLITIRGTPGSGKTTIAKLFEFSALATLLRGANLEGYADLISALQGCEVLKQGKIQVLACRLPLESDYQEIWQLPYSEKIRTDLLQRLIQARAVLAWFAQLQRTGITVESVSFEPRDNCADLLALVGGKQGVSVLNRAREVEAAVYAVIGALIPPSDADIEAKFRDPYRLFDSLESVHLNAESAIHTEASNSLRPLIILDDAHFLHTQQLQSLNQWLIRRELRIARWILSRLDVLQPSEVFDSFREERSTDVPGITTERDFIRINLQSTSNRAEGRRTFRSMTREMSRKYLRQMEIFRQSEVNDLEALLPSRVEPLALSQLEKIKHSVRATATRLRISDARLNELTQLVEAYAPDGRQPSEDVRQAMVRILLHRYVKRVPQQTLLLDEEPAKPLKADSDLYDGACVQLFHEFDRPYYVGFDAISDAASENAEMFLRLAFHIVEVSENRLIKQRPPTISPGEQHRLLRERATKILGDWNFPEHRRVRRLTDWIGKRCLERTLEPNAPLASGANALGIPWAEFLTISTTYPELASILKYAVAYNAISLVPQYECKKQVWCLLELGGVVVVRHGLTFKRGGFVEGTAYQMSQALSEGS